jgi:virginiamycin B lyase
MLPWHKLAQGWRWLFSPQQHLKHPRQPRLEVETLEQRLVPTTTIIEYNMPPDLAHGPVVMSAGNNGAVWFTEPSVNKIAEMTTSGVFLEFSTAPYTPAAICRGPGNSMWFTEQNGTTSAVGKITNAGIITNFKLPTASAGPEGIASSGTNLWVCEETGNKIAKVTSTGAVTEFALTTAGSDPLAISYNSTNRVMYFTESGHNAIGSINTKTGAIVETAVPTAASTPFGITFVNSLLGAYFTEQNGNNIGEITGGYETNGGTVIAGTITETPVPTAGSQPEGIAFGINSSVWFTEYGSGKIGAMNVFTKAISEYQPHTVGSGPAGIISLQGSMWFSETLGNHIGQVKIT